MLNPELQAKIKNLVKVKWQKSLGTFNSNVSTVLNDAESRGLLSSSIIAINNLQAVYVKQFRASAHLVWQSIVRVYDEFGTGYSETLSQELNEEFDNHLLQLKKLIIGTYKSKHSHLLDFIPRPNASLNLDKIHDELIEEHSVEIDFYVNNLKNKDQYPQQSSEYHFYGNVGHLQTGANSTMAINQASPQSITEIVSALHDINSQIDTIKSEPLFNIVEIKEIISEAEAILKSENWNNTRLISLLTTIVTTVQGLACCQPAYERLKLCLMSFGINLP